MAAFGVLCYLVCALRAAGSSSARPSTFSYSESVNTFIGSGGSGFGSGGHNPGAQVGPVIPLSHRGHTRQACKQAR